MNVQPLSVAILLSLVCGDLLGQNEPIAPSVAPEVEVTADVANLTTQLQLIEANSDLDPTAKAKAIDAFKQAIAAAESAESFKQKRISLEAQRAAIDDELRKARAALSVPASSETPSTESISLKELDNRVQQSTAEVETARQAVAASEEVIANRELRLIEIPKTVAEANARLSVVEQERRGDPPVGEPSQVTTARDAMLDQKRIAIQSEIDALKAENAWQLESGELLPLVRDLKKRELAARQGELTVWQTATARRRENEVDVAIESARLEVASTPNSLKPLAAANLSSAEARRQTESQLKATIAQEEQLKTRLTDLTQRFERARTEAKTQANVTESVGAILRQQRNELPRVQLHKYASKLRQQKFSEVRQTLFLLREELDELSDLDEATENARRQMEASNELAPQIQRLLSDRRKLLTGLTTDTNAYLNALAKLDGTEQLLATTAKEFGTYIDERVLWIRSAQPFALNDLRESLGAMTTFVGEQNWRSVPSDLASRLRTSPLIPLLCVLVFLPIPVLGIRMRRALRQLGEKAIGGGCRDFGLTLRASLLTLGIAIVWPGFLYQIGLWLQRSGPAAGDPSSVFGAFSTGLVSAAAVLLPLELWRQASRAKGLIESHFGGTSRSVKLVHSNLRWLTLSLVPLVAIVAAIQATANPIYERSIGRLVFVAAVVTLAVFVYRIAHPKRGAWQKYFGKGSDSLFYRTRFVWFPSLIAIPVALATLSVVGYQFTAVQLASRLQWTCFLLLGLAYLNALALRWVVLSRRRLAIEQARARLAHVSDHAESGPGSLEAQANLQEIDLQSVDLQTRRLVRALTITVGAIAFWTLWVDVLPALSRFDEITAWDTQVPTIVANDSESASGTAVTTIITVESVSYADVFIAILILVGTLLATRDVPGLLELILLQRLPLDVALRFAITTLTRYLIFLFGIIWALGTIHVGWSKVQWLVAAISVGLGFGLQEIFANFVSGLIILFERPLRAGDIVTIDGVTGTVRNVKMRATTIQDLDRKDFIVPNKDFITGRVLNWTLTDEISRLVVNVGVAYGSDTALAKKLMLEAADADPQVLNDPPPQAAFEEFGESSLNLTLRCFLALQNMPSRLAIVDRLNSAIDLAFRKEGIEIPFPQRDLHLRSSDVPLTRDAATPQNNET